MKGSMGTAAPRCHAFGALPIIKHVSYNKANLHAIDKFFMLTRRRPYLLERPMSSAGSAVRRWHGYSPYNPVMVQKVLDILRVFFNYVQAGIDKKTPAMRLGGVDRRVRIEDILK